MSDTIAARQIAADQEFQSYNFGEVGVEDASGWEYASPGDIWTRAVFVRAEDEEPTQKIAFTVRFAPACADVVEAYAIDAKGSIWGARAAASAPSAPKRTATLVFLRYDNADVVNVGVLTLRTSLESDVEVKGALVAATTHWVNTTEAGRKLWSYSCADLNIGDLAGSSSFEDADLLRALRERDLEYVDCFVGDCDDALPYDEVLVDEELVAEVEAD